MKTGFDNEKYLKMQSEHIKERINQFDNKLYLEFGGKLFDDYHASRVLPGFAPDSKLRMLMQLSDQAEIVMAVSAADIEKNKVRGDLGITYDDDTLRLIDEFRAKGLYVGSVVITKFTGQANAVMFKKKLENLGIRVYNHYLIPGYPSNIPLIVSDDGFGKNDYIETSRPLVVVTAPGPGSGKMATCLSQLYHEHKRGIHAGYNRDVEIFPVLNAIFENIFGESPYKSPTDMGVNMAGNCIIDDEACKEASRQEIIRRYYHALEGIAAGTSTEAESFKIELLMKQEHLTVQDRSTVSPALVRAEATNAPAAAMELPSGKIITGKTSSLLGPCAALILNAIKELAGIDHEKHIISPTAIEPIQTLKTKYLGSKNPRLHTDEVLIALSSTAARSDDAKLALTQLARLKGCQVHSSVILSSADRKTFQKLGCDLTCEPKYQ